MAVTPPLPSPGKKLQLCCQTDARAILGARAAPGGGPGASLISVGQEVSGVIPHHGGQPATQTALLRHPQRTPLATACAPPRTDLLTVGVERSALNQVKLHLNSYLGIVAQPFQAIKINLCSYVRDSKPLKTVIMMLKVFCFLC